MISGVFVESFRLFLCICVAPNGFEAFSWSLKNLLLYNSDLPDLTGFVVGKKLNLTKSTNIKESLLPVPLKGN